MHPSSHQNKQIYKETWVRLGLFSWFLLLLWLFLLCDCDIGVVVVSWLCCYCCWLWIYRRLTSACLSCVFIPLLSFFRHKTESFTLHNAQNIIKICRSRQRKSNRSAQYVHSPSNKRTGKRWTHGQSFVCIGGHRASFVLMVQWQPTPHGPHCELNLRLLLYRIAKAAHSLARKLKRLIL